MSGDIVLSAALRNNLLSLQGTQRSIDITQFRLSTGLKVNSALDNPQNFFAAQSLNNRASDLQRLLDGISQSIRTIEEADKGVSALTDLVEQADAIATEAQSEIRAAEGFANIRGTEDLSGVTDLTSLSGIVDGTTDKFDVVYTEYNASTDSFTSVSVTVDIAANDTADNIVASINSDATINTKVRASLTSGGQLKIESLVDGGNVRLQDNATNGLGIAGFTALGLDSVVGLENDDDPTATIAAGTAIAGNVLKSARSDAGTVNGKYEASATLNDAGYLATGVAGTDELTVRIKVDGTSSSDITLDKGDTIQQFVDAINNDASINSNVTASFNVDTGQLEITAATGVGQIEIEYVDESGTANPQFGFGTRSADGALGAATNIDSELFTFVGTSADLAQFESDYNNVRDQIDALVADAQYRGTNLLSGDDLVTDFNEDRTSSLTTNGVDFTALGLGISEGNFTTSSTIQASLDEVRAALADVRNFGQSIANDLAIIQTRQEFTEQTITTLKAGADDLTVADQNEEGANLLALQTRQQLGVTSLALASQSQQSVLRLF